MISVRLPREIESKLDRMARDGRLSKSSIIKKALLMYLKENDSTRTPYDLGSDLFGRHGSGSGRLSADYKKLLGKKLREKHSR